MRRPTRDVRAALLLVALVALVHLWLGWAPGHLWRGACIADDGGYCGQAPSASVTPNP